MKIADTIDGKTKITLFAKDERWARYTERLIRRIGVNLENDQERAEAIAAADTIKKLLDRFGANGRSRTKPLAWQKSNAPLERQEQI